MNSPLDATPVVGFDNAYQAVIQALEEGVILFDSQGAILTCNPAAERTLGLSLAQMQGRTALDPRWHTVDEDGLPLEGTSGPVVSCLRTGESQTTVIGVQKPTGELRWLRVNARPIKQGPKVTHVAASFADITEQRATHERLARQAAFRAALIQVVTESLENGLDESFYQRLLGCAAEVIPGAQAGSLLLLEDGRYKFAAATSYDLPALQQTYLLPSEMYVGEGATTLQLIYGFDNFEVSEDRQNLLRVAGRTDEIKVCMSIPVVVAGEPIAYFSLDNFETKDAFTREAMDMGRIFAQQVAALWQRFKLEAGMKRMAFYDALTGLPNRSLLYERLGRAVAHHQRQRRPLAVMFIDLDNFKHVNDTYGHDVGDELLRRVAERLSGVLREGDTLARWGGDEFVLLLTDLAHPEDAALVAEKVLDALRHPFRVGGREVRTQCSIGIDTLQDPAKQDPAKSVDEIIKYADIALYRTKAAGKNTYHFFTSEMNQRLHERLSLEYDLREALRQQAFVLHYQPRIDLKTQRVTSVEALVRWSHPTRGLVSPGAFIPVAEESGLILPLGDQVLDMAVRQASMWGKSGRPWHVAVNVSVKQLSHPGFVASVQETLARHALSPRRLEIEITESAAMSDIDDTVGKLRELRALGVHVALDDFGTAYSSLTYLKRLPLDVLKIDQAFVRDLTDTSLDTSPDGVRDAEIVRAIIALGQGLNLTVVAEGVETPAQLRLLKILGCNEVQGYYLARPQPAADLDEYMGKRLGSVEQL